MHYFAYMKTWCKVLESKIFQNIKYIQIYSTVPSVDLVHFSNFLCQRNVFFNLLVFIADHVLVPGNRKYKISSTSVPSYPSPLHQACCEAKPSPSPPSRPNRPPADLFCQWRRHWERTHTTSDNLSVHVILYFLHNFQCILTPILS